MIIHMVVVHLRKNDRTLFIAESLGRNGLETGRARDVVRRSFRVRCTRSRCEYNTVVRQRWPVIFRWQGRDNRYAADSTMVIVNQGILKIWQDICWLSLVYRVTHGLQCLPIKYSIMLPGQQTNFRHVMVIAGMYSQRHFRQLAIQGYQPCILLHRFSSPSPLSILSSTVLAFFWKASRGIARSTVLEWSMELYGARDEPLFETFYATFVSVYLKAMGLLGLSLIGRLFKWRKLADIGLLKRACCKVWDKLEGNAIL